MIRVPDIASTLEPAEHLLVITPAGGSGRYGLLLPFNDATLVEAGQDGFPADERPERPVDSIVIESPVADVGWADRILGELYPVTSETSTVVVAFGPEYASVTGSDDSPAALKTLPGFRVVRVGLLGGAVSLVLSRCGGASSPAEADAAFVAATTSLALELESLSRDRQPQSESGPRAARTQGANMFELRDEVHRLSAELTSTRKKLQATTREYSALRRSHLGRITVGYWRFRRRLAGRLKAGR